MTVRASVSRAALVTTVRVIPDLHTAWDVHVPRRRDRHARGDRERDRHGHLRPTLKEIVLYAAAPDVRMTGHWTRVADPTAAGGVRAYDINYGAPKMSQPSWTPANALVIPFVADQNLTYKLWIRLKAASDSWANDSVWVQFGHMVVDRRGTDWSRGGQPRTVRRLRRVRLGLARQQLWRERQHQRSLAAVRDHWSAATRHLDAGGWRVDRSDRALRREISDAPAGRDEERPDDPAGDATGAVAGTTNTMIATRM